MWLPWGEGGAEQPTDVLKNAAALNDLGRYSEAANLLKDPALAGNARAHYLKGIALENTGRLDEAVAAYSECLKLEPNNSDALNNRAVVYGKLNLLNEAIADLEQTVEMNDSDSLAWTNLGLAYHSLGKYDDAVEKYIKAESLSTDPEIPFQRGNTYLANGNLSAALADFDKAIAAQSEFALAHYKRAVTLLSSNRFLESAKSLANAKRHDTEMELRPLITEMEQYVEAGFEQNERRSADVQTWLAQNGWEITGSDRPEFSFYASRLPVAGASERPTDSDSLFTTDINSFYGLILLNKQEGLICPSNAVDALQGDTELAVSLFVFDLAAAAQQNAEQLNDLPEGLNRIEFDWKPKQEQLQPTAYAIALPPPVVSSTPQSSVSADTDVGQAPQISATE